MYVSAVGSYVEYYNSVSDPQKILGVSSGGRDTKIARKLFIFTNIETYTKLGSSLCYFVFF